MISQDENMWSHLLEPISLGNLELQNRVVKAAMVTCYADREGYVTERLVKHYVKHAKGGAGLIVVEVSSIAASGKAFGNQLGLHKDDFIPGLKDLARAVKESGPVKCIIQLHHGGRRAPSMLNSGAQPVAPSAIPIWGGETPRELTPEEIEGLIEAYALAAMRAEEAG